MTKMDFAGHHFTSIHVLASGSDVAAAQGSLSLNCAASFFVSGLVN